MTRSFRAIRLTHVSLLTTFVIAALTFSTAAFADGDAPTVLRQTFDAADALSGNDVPNDVATENSDASNDVASLASVPDEPTIETPLHHLYCVEYARLRSGLEIFGDAKTWWQHAENIYARFTQPAAEAVMVFSGSARLARGHVAVATRPTGATTARSTATRPCWMSARRTTGPKCAYGTWAPINSAAASTPSRDLSAAARPPLSGHSADCFVAHATRVRASSD
jgi:hypothetical protein